jgi:hypothetical protein
MSSHATSGSVQHAGQILDLVASEATDARRDDLLARLDIARRLLADSRVRVQVVGGQRQGKSALIEALMVSGRQEPPLPRHLPGLELIESPSAGWGPGPEQAHAVLFVSDSAAPLTSTELAQLRRTVDLCPMTVFVQTKIDAVAAWQEVLERNIVLMRDAGLSVETWVLSSVGRLRGEWTGDDHLNISSGVPALHAQLHRLCADFESTGLRIVSHHALAVLTELGTMVLARRAELTGAAGTEQIEARIAELDARQKVLRDRSVRWPALLSNGFATVHADTSFDLRRRVEKVRAHLDQVLSDRLPFENWGPIAGWLRHRMEMDAQANRQFAAAAGEGVAQRAAEHFGLTEPVPLPPAEEEQSHGFPDAPAADREPTDPVVKLSAAVNILMRAWMGFMMYFLIAGIAHLQLSPLMGLMPAGALAVTAMIEERKHWISRDRSKAAMTLHRYVDVATVKASNDSGELLRRLEQRLREAYGAHIDRQETELQRERQAAQVRVAEIEAAPALLEEIDTGLRYYEQLRQRASTLVAAHLLDAADQARRPAAGDPVD